MYFIVQNWEFITTRPMFEQFRLFEIMFLMTGLVFCLLFIAVSWSFISKKLNYLCLSDTLKKVAFIATFYFSPHKKILKILTAL
ncbi:hypothetical protein C3Z13_04115 [Avibacterium endocarditidis]|uniref:Uncharacterized protein n=1 Tax=Avibacterium endocarditidis TaxID=380674 RepID=A0ABX4ZT06_9PAST|nr:hypothetical protein C3Z13_04115 [Avibacterium endocarditidis]